MASKVGFSNRPEKISRTGFAAPAFHKGKAGEQAPIERVRVGSLQEYGGEMLGGTKALVEEFA